MGLDDFFIIKDTDYFIVCASEIRTNKIQDKTKIKTEPLIPCLVTLEDTFF